MRKTQAVLSFAMLVCGIFTANSALAEAYCYITEVNCSAVSNAVQIEVKSDGILRWDWTWGDDQGKRDLISVTFTNARLKLDQHYLDVDTPPVGTVMFYTPQDAPQGIGVVMEVTLSERSNFKGRSSTDERTFVLTVDAPLRSDNGEAKSKGEGKDATDEVLSVDVRDDLVTVRALRADIHRVVAEIARQAGLNITVDDAVTHKVNANLTRMAPLDAIRAIAAGYGLALSSKGDVTMLSEGVPRDLTTYNRSGTASFPVRYLRAEDAKELLPSFLVKYVQSNEEQNAVVATAPDQMLAKIGSDLKSVDLPPPLIMVEVVAVELTGTGDYERDITALYTSHHERLGVSSATGVLQYEDTVAGGLTGGVIANTAKLTGTLIALQTEGKARIQSNPRVAAVNGKPAEIFIGQDRFILVQYQSSGTTQERIDAVPVGVNLEVRPWTGGNGEITTYVRVTVSNISEVDPATGLPLLSTREATSTVRTRDGETIVIGGLRQTQQETTRRRIPILSDIPILGALFEGQTTSSVESELVIFVTPRIISVDGEILDTSQEEIRQRLLEPGDCGYTGDQKQWPALTQETKDTQ